MKKTILLIFTLVVIYTVGLISFFEYKEKDKEITIGKDKINGIISVMVENENGKYERSNSSSWPNGDYELNKNLSKCENGSELKYDKKTKKVTMSTSKTDRCYLYFDITGTETNPYKIETIEDLVNLSNDVNSGNSYAGKYIVLTRDLDFLDKDSYENSERMDYEDINGNSVDETLITELTTGSGFKPIGNIKIAFEGNFNGKEHRINNLYINVSDYSKNYVGFIGHIKNATISNLTIQGSIHSEIENNLGGISGYVTSGNIENCVNEVNVTSDSDDWGTGGLIGPFTGNVEITNCINKGNVKGGLISGGIACNGDGDNNIIITKSANYGNIENTSERVGGILGNVTSEAKIIESFNNGKIKGTSYTGGLVGYTSGNLEINDSYNTGKVYREGESDNFCGVGGILGESSTTASVSIKKSYNSGDVIDNDSLDQRAIFLGGIIGSSTTPNLTIEDCINYGKLLNPNINHLNHIIYFGGIIGYIMNFTQAKIINSYNYGDIIDARWAGGIIGHSSSSTTNENLIINKCANFGNVISNLTGNVVSAGIIAVNFYSNTMILNSYNTAKIYGANYASGIIGSQDHESTGKIINCYNSGSIWGGNYASGIINFYYRESKASISLNNIYNLGIIDGNVNKNEIIAILNPNLNTNYTINNSYYREGLKASNTNIDATPLSETDMKSQKLVDLLNENISKIQLKEIDPLLEDYTLSKWKLGIANYPTLANE